MRLLKHLTFVVLCSLTFQCGAILNKFSIEILHYGGGPGISLYYIVRDSYVRVDTDCDLQNCMRQTVYQRDLTKLESDSLLTVIKNLHLDTLKHSYKPKGIVFDGLVTSIKLRGTDLPHMNITIDNVHLPTTDSLYRIIDKLISIKKYRFYDFGQE